MIEKYRSFKRVIFKASYPYSPVKEAESLMESLLFSKIDHHCVYEGPVAKLVSGLLKLGWYHELREGNKYLLAHPDCVMVFNYAASADCPSNRYVSYFRSSF